MNYSALAGSRRLALILAPVALALGGVWALPTTRTQPAYAQAAGTTATTATSTTGGIATPAVSHEIQEIWLGECAVCHGSDARGTNRGPSLLGVGAAFVDYELTTGRMPLPATASSTEVTHHRAPKYSPAVIRQLVAYVTSFSGSGVPIPHPDLARADVAAGGELFRLNCAACHAWAGDGGALVHREAPALHKATPTQVAEAVRVGPGVMPAFGTAALSNGQLDDVVAYVRYLDHPRDRGGNPLWHLGPMAEGGATWFIGIALLYLAVRWIGETEPPA